MRTRRCGIVAFALTVALLRPALAATLPVSGAAFHVDASDTSTMTISEESGVQYVTEWRDVDVPTRKATTISGLDRPFITKDDTLYKSFVDFGSGKYGNTGSYGAGLAWSWTDSSIREIFLVYSDYPGSSGSFLLGAKNSYQFHRDGKGLFNVTYSSSYLRSGLIEVDGTSVAYSYQLPEGFHIIHLRTTGGVTADRLASDRDTYQKGAQRLAEVVVYDKTLSDTESAQVYAYLYQKWFVKPGVDVGDELLTNGSFEDGTVISDNSGAYGYYTAGKNYTTAWTGGVLAKANTAFGNASGCISGTYCAIIQSSGSLQQSFSVPAPCKAKLTYNYKHRTNDSGGAMYTGVYIDDVLQGAEFTTPAGDYNTRTASVDVELSAGDHVLKITARNSSGDNSTYYDVFSLVVTAALDGIAIDPPAATTFWDGDGARPAVVVRNAQSDEVLEEGVDYTVSYASNTWSSTKAMVYATGIGNYSGVNAEATFTAVAMLDPNDYGNRLLITPAAGKVTGDFRNFPCLVRLSTARQPGFDPAACGTDGGGLRFALEDGTQLSYEIDTWNADGESLVWVNLPTLSASTRFYAYWGLRSGRSVPDNWPRGAWPDHPLVLHMNGTGTTESNAGCAGPLLDATRTASGTYSTSTTEARIGSCRYMDASSSGRTALTVPNYDATEYAVNRAFAAEAWFKFPVWNVSSHGEINLFNKGTYGVGGWYLYFKSRYTYGGVYGRDQSMVPDGDFYSDVRYNWQHVTVTSDGQYFRLYVNGVLKRTGGDVSGYGYYVASRPFYIQGWGYVDECRVRRGKPSDAWVALDYKMQTDKDFFTYGDIVSQTVTVDPIDAQLDYTGAYPHVAPVVRNAAGDALTAGTDYTVAYANDAVHGTVRVTVTGAGGYAGATATAEYAVSDGFGLYQHVLTGAQDWTNWLTDDPAGEGSVVPGALVASSYNASYAYRGVTYVQGAYETWCYRGVMYLESAHTYRFYKNYDDSIWLKLTAPDGTAKIVMADTSASTASVYSFQPSTNGWFKVDVRMGNGCGAYGPRSAPASSASQLDAGLAWNVDGPTTCTTSNYGEWRKFLDTADDVFLYPEQPRWASGRVCRWINADATSAHAWTEASNWEDGAVPSADGSDDVYVGVDAAIDFSGAVIHTLVQEAGALEVLTASGSLTLVGDLVLRGDSAEWRADTLLSRGAHALSNACDVVCRPGAAFGGLGGVVKRGAGTWGAAGSSAVVYSFPGSVVVREGTFVTAAGGRMPGPAKVESDGPTARFVLDDTEANAIDPATVVRVGTSGKGGIFGVTGTSAFAVEELWFLGRQVAAGAWSPYPHGLPDGRCWPDLYGDAAPITVASGTGTFEPVGPDLDSGRTRTWTGAAGDGDAENPLNWAEGVPPWSCDSVVIDAEGAPATVRSMDFHDVLLNCSWGAGDLAVSGALHLRYGSLTRAGSSFALTGLAPHVVDGTGWMTLSAGGTVSGTDGVRVCGTGGIRLGAGSARPCALAGDLVVSGGGHVVQEASCGMTGPAFPLVTNVVVTGTGSSVELLTSEGFTNAAVVAVSDFARLRVGAGIDQRVRRFFTDGRSRAARAYTGVGPVGYRIPEYLGGEGTVTPSRGGAGLLILGHGR